MTQPFGEPYPVGVELPEASVPGAGWTAADLAMTSAPLEHPSKWALYYPEFVEKPPAQEEEQA